MLSPKWPRVLCTPFQEHQFVYINYFPKTLILQYSYSLEHRLSPRDNYKSMHGCIHNPKVSHMTSDL